MSYKFFNMSRRAWNKFYSGVFDDVLRHALDDYKYNVSGRHHCMEPIFYGVENAAAEALKILLKKKPECFTRELSGKTVLTVDRLAVYSDNTYAWVRYSVIFHMVGLWGDWGFRVEESILGREAVPDAGALTSNLVAPRLDASGQKLASIVAKFAEAHAERNANLVEYGYAPAPWLGAPLPFRK